MSPRALVTGGAGYVGSHCARRLVRAGFEVATVDDLSQGHRLAVSGGLVEADVRDRQALVDVLGRGFDVVLHFAALTSVGGSSQAPVDYWDVNVGGTIALLRAMAETDTRHLVVSSTCAVHGIPTRIPIRESGSRAPISPYGDTKAAMERLVEAAAAAGALSAITLRYFNAAGAAEDGWLGEAHHPETHLIPLALEAASRQRPMKLFGSDHPTPDGTCIRDYVHVEDLAEAHLAAAQRLLSGGPSATFNLGTGHGASVLEVVRAVERVAGPVPLERAPRRPGDPPALVADPRAALDGLGWRARRGLDQMVRDAWRWARSPRFGPKAPADGDLRDRCAPG